MDTNAAPSNDLGANDPLPGMPDAADLEDTDPAIAEIDTSGEAPQTDEPSEVADPMDIASDPKEEEDARQYGWVTKDEWVAQGKPEKHWRSAAEFNVYRSQAAPVLAKANKELLLKVAKLEADALIREQVEADARRNIQKESLALKLRQAREDNDWDAADRITEELLDIKLAEKTAPKSQQVENPRAAAAFNTFLDASSIYKTDTDLQEALAIEVRSLIQLRGNGDPEGILKAAGDRVKRMYPEKFAKPAHAMGDTGGTGGGVDTGGSGLGWNDLKPDVRRQYESMVGNGVTREGLLKSIRKQPHHLFFKGR